VRIRVLFYGMARDLAGKSADSIEIPEGGRLRDVFEWYASRIPALRGFDSSIVLSRNHEFAPRDTAVADGDEVAFLPPVSGGSGFTFEITDPETGNFFALTRQPIDSQAATVRLLRGEDGAVVDFLGVVRNNTKGRRTRFLEYECYEPMAVKLMAQIGREIHAAHPIGRIAMLHRLGHMEIGEASVAVVVTAPHRRPAFEAALEGINRLKKTVPIWKKEFFEDGEVWVEGEWDDSVIRKSS